MTSPKDNNIIHNNTNNKNNNRDKVNIKNYFNLNRILCCKCNKVIK